MLILHNNSIKILNKMAKQTNTEKCLYSKGKGLHTGLPITITFNPAEPKYWLPDSAHRRRGTTIIAALAEHVTDNARGTVVEQNGVKVSTIEHAMAALYAAG